MVTMWPCSQRRWLIYIWRIPSSSDFDIWGFYIHHIVLTLTGLGYFVLLLTCILPCWSLRCLKCSFCKFAIIYGHHIFDVFRKPHEELGFQNTVFKFLLTKITWGANCPPYMIGLHWQNRPPLKATENKHFQTTFNEWNSLVLGGKKWKQKSGIFWQIAPQAGFNEWNSLVLGGKKWKQKSGVFWQIAPQAGFVGTFKKFFHKSINIRWGHRLSYWTEASPHPWPEGSTALNY